MSTEAIRSNTPIPEETSIACHCCDAITTLVVPILLAIAVSLSIYYAVHSALPLVPITSHFSISLPLLICSVTGLALAIVLIVQIARRGQAAIACGKCAGHQVGSAPKAQQGIRTLLYIGGRPEDQTTEQYQMARKEWVASAAHQVGPMVTFLTRDGVELRGFWHQKGKYYPTVIFFHGNQMTAEGCWPYGKLYADSHCNVLLVEFRGYGISEGKAAGVNAELEAYYDAEAALKFVHSKGVDPTKIVAHGYSLGGAYAAALGYFFHVPYVILHNTFTDCSTVAAHVSKVIPHEMIAPSFAASFKSGSAPPLPEFPDALSLQTDGFDNLNKVKSMRGQVLVIQAENDNLISLQSGTQLVQAKYSDTKDQETHLITLPAGHDPWTLLQNGDALNQISLFLRPTQRY